MASETNRARQDGGTLKGLWQHKRACITVIGLTASGSLTFYTFTTYMQKYLVNTVGMSPKVVSTLMMLAIPLISALSTVFSLYAVFGLVFSALMIVVFYTSIGGLLKTEMFPTEIFAA